VGPLQWGDVPTAVAAVFAGGAAWFAYQTIKSQRQQIGEQREFIGEQLGFMAEQRQNLELERAELRAAAEYRRWAQARQIAMHHRRTGRDSEGHGWAVTVQNPTDAPVRHVEVRFGSAYLASEAFDWPAFDPEPRDLRVIPRGDTYSLPLDLLGPGRAARFISQRWTSAIAHNNRPTLYFTDDAGARWSLDSYGKLEEMPSDDPSGSS